MSYNETMMKIDRLMDKLAAERDAALTRATTAFTALDAERQRAAKLEAELARVRASLAHRVVRCGNAACRVCA